MNIIFGTDGWRGIINEEFNSETVAAVAQAFSDYLNNISEKPSIAAGYDGRRFSKEFATLFSQITISNGIQTFLSDSIVPTPFVSFYVKKFNLNAGVMITASHNPPVYNGIKFKAKYGGPFTTNETAEIEKLLYKNKILNGNVDVKVFDFFETYLEHINSIINFDIIRESGIKILVDSMGGAGQSVLKKVFRTHNIDIDSIFDKADEEFYGRLAEPIEKNLKPLADELRKSGIYSIGLATDGDADRLGVLLENGQWLSAQETILLLTDYIVNTRKLKGDIIKTSSVTDKLRLFQVNGERLIHDVQVGFKYICEKMIQTDAVAGFEESGGFGFKINFPERDGIFSALLFCELLATSGFNKLSTLLSEKRKIFGNIYYDRIDLHYYKPDRLELLPIISEKNNLNTEDFLVVNKALFYSSRGVINGIKIYFEGISRWLLIRSSETEPMFRIYAEGESENEVKRLLEIGLKLLEN